MQERTTPQASTTPQVSSAARPRMRDEIFGPPRPTGRAPFSAALFGVLLVASLVAPAVTGTPPMPGLSLVFLGLMSSLGFADVLDVGRRRFAIVLRASGFAVALLGLALQLF